MSVGSTSFFILLYIDYQVTTFGHQYSFEWRFCFDDISTQSFPLQKARFFTATSMLGTRTKSRLQSCQRIFSLSGLSLFLWDCLYNRSLSVELMSFLQLRWFYDTFWTKSTNKNFYQTWRPASLEILRCYVIKAPYVPKVIGTELKQPTKKKNVTTWV